MKLHDCDICGSPAENAKPIWVAERYIGNVAPPVICGNCGFCYVQERRSSAEIAEDWKRIYKDKLYDPTWPGVKARLYYVAEWIDQNIGLRNKTLLDIGGGTGTFCEFAGSGQYGADPQYFDPATEDHEIVEKFITKSMSFDIVTILWTLENCGDCNAMIAKARECLKPNGHLVVATGSRILVPFRKPMSQYFSTEPQDLHAFRWSIVSLRNIMAKHGIKPLAYNDYEQNDVLLLCGQPREKVGKYFCDESPLDVENHFIDWYRSFP